MVCIDCREGDHDLCREVLRQTVLGEGHINPEIDAVLISGSQWCDCLHKAKGVNRELLRLEEANGTTAEAARGDTA